MRYLHVPDIMPVLFTLLVLLDITEAVHPQADQRLTAATFLQVSEITEVGPPRVFDDFIVFTYEQPTFARYVAAAFRHEDFKERHVFTAREREGKPDLFFLVYPIDYSRESPVEVEYRFVVDGVWLTDPHAPDVRPGPYGVTVGSVSLNEAPPYERRSPVFDEDGSVTFLFALNLRVSPTLETVGRRRITISSLHQPIVSISGTFNGWDPYMHRLSGPDRHGFYSIRLPVPAGPHYYYYMVEGQRVLDPFNDTRARDLQTGMVVSRIDVPR